MTATIKHRLQSLSQVATDAETLDHARKSFDTIFHDSYTCETGLPNITQAVVDSKVQVIGADPCGLQMPRLRCSYHQATPGPHFASLYRPLCLHFFKYQVEVNTQFITPFTPFTLHPMQIPHLPTFHTPPYANTANMTSIMGCIPNMSSHSLLHGNDGTEAHTSLHHSLYRR